uniref:Uncharacterized protein n=1 Tax=Romanomermis culicivorax TaxID=13658 RepID=A0A915IP35_ROMCU
MQRFYEITPVSNTLLSISKVDELIRMVQIASEGVENIRTVQALTREKTFYDSFVAHLNGPYKQALIQTQYHSVSYAFAQCVIFFLYAACFRFGGYLIEIGDTSPLNVFKVFFAITFCGMTLSWATAYFPDFIKARFSAALIFKMMREKPVIDNMSAAGLKEQLEGNVTLKDIQFSYPSRQNVQILRHLDLKVEKGQTVALVGPSGCGKSTIVNLLERFYDPIGGSVLYDENDLKILNLQSLRQQVSLVSQEPVLFNCSLLENISYGLTDVRYDKVTNAAKMANIHSFILGLPEGYQTKVGERGVMLSGGQKQRVAIARALIRDPKILILDEATSALDTENEKLVQEALDRAREGRTCIVIAHRLSTVQNATKIAVIKHGRIVEEGSHSDLVNKRGIYYSLTEKQNLLR